MDSTYSSINAPGGLSQVSHTKQGPARNEILLLGSNKEDTGDSSQTSVSQKGGQGFHLKGCGVLVAGLVTTCSGRAKSAQVH